MMLLINPRTGDVINATTMTLFIALVKDGWMPIGVQGKALAATVLAGA